MNQKMCSNCKKSSSEYYELKVQIRFTYFNNDEEIAGIKSKVCALIGKRFNTINKTEYLDNGIDFYFRTLGELNKISTLFHNNFLVEEKRSRKIIGHNFLESKDIWRHTMLINIINLNVGDYVQIKGVKYWIKAFNKNDLVLRSLDNGSKEVVTYSIVKDYIQKIDKS